MIYVPILRSRQEEFKVLKEFEFEKNIYPCVEIIKEIDRVLPPQTARQQLIAPRKEKTFEDTYISLIEQIKARFVFVDLPIHLKTVRGMDAKTVEFLRTVVANREERTEFIKKLSPVSKRVIPVISTYSEITGERESILKQEKDLRSVFNLLAFRTFAETFDRDIVQIEKVIRPTDFIIMDWKDMQLDLEDGDQVDILERLKTLKCKIIVHRNSIPSTIKNSGLEHGKLVEEIDNSLQTKFRDFEGIGFSDYSGIKKDNISGAPIRSPGFLYYDAVRNEFYGYRYKKGGHKKGETPPSLSEYENTIIPAVIASDATRRMKRDFLGSANQGWAIIKNIELGERMGGESGKSPAKFKRIGMLHYLHCIKTKISRGSLK